MIFDVSRGETLLLLQTYHSRAPRSPIRHQDEFIPCVDDHMLGPLGQVAYVSSNLSFISSSLAYVVPFTIPLTGSFLFGSQWEGY